MLFYADIDSQNMVEQPGVQNPLAEIIVPRAPNVPIVVQFVSGGVVVDPEVLEATILSSSAANPSVVVTDGSHGFTSGDTVVISDHTGTPHDITSSSVASPTVITATAHGLSSGDTVAIEDHSTSDLTTAKISTSSVASPSVVTTATAHGLTSGDSVTIDSHIGAPVSISTSSIHTSATTITAPSHGLAAGTTTVLISGHGTSGILIGSIASSSAASSTVITTLSAHGLTSGDRVTIASHSGAPKTISSVTASTDIITTSTAHGLTAGDVVTIADNLATVPDINGSQTVFSTPTPTTFKIGAPTNITVDGSGGSVTRLTSTPTINGSYNVTVLSSTTFSIPLTVTVGGAGGTVTRDPVNLNGTRVATYVDANTFTIPVASPMVNTGGTVSLPSSTPTINGTRIVTVINDTSFTIPVAVTTGGVSGNVTRAASDINGAQVATVTGENTFTIPVSVSSPGSGGTVTRTTSSPTINGSQVVTVIDDTSFSVPVNVTSGGASGTATRTTALALRWTVKEDGKYDQDPPMASLTSFTKSGSGATTTFKGSVNYVTTSLDALLGIEAPQSKTATITIASPGVITTSTQAWAVGDSVSFTTTGALPTGLTAGVNYYITSTSLTTTTITVSATSGGTAINTSGSQSGTHTITRTVIVDDADEAVLMAELSFVGAHPGKTNWVRHLIRNDLYKGSEGSAILLGAALNYGRTALASGIISKAIVFGTNFAAIPVISGLSVEKAATGDDNIFVVGLSDVSISGFTAHLNDFTANANCFLHWTALKP